ncbi:8-oxo-dGTP pyrophosphatase MutT (NUDIX family) [Tamaricihabitans halophyticus]|uniref:8-oxo-dGTP pyrophosphatase MutT (NUDIX family) n=1 Tax=Tamaricihabitans halophyticus TaxID=1262583 RepID=A0A4R2R559_9PSEU|nr:CoA pyrophosphatase [Tamaricihabitans halophyticus]TCP56868.1 8-oxo-dGTP pyrophosphatase MutT (NUDIX family) [Tamaricihabitans halophyticus]
MTAGWGAEPGPLVDPHTVPSWLRDLVRATSVTDGRDIGRLTPPDDPGLRSAAVLMLFGAPSASGALPDVLLLRRADGGDVHSGQVAFPGGGAEPADGGPVDTALREAQEETGVHPAGVRPVALLPEMYVPVSGFRVTPVLAHWERPSPVGVVDDGEVAAVARVPVAELVDPANRFLVRIRKHYRGPAFGLPGMLVWGFTAGVLTWLLDAAGWAEPWDDRDVRDLDVALAAAARAAQPSAGCDSGGSATEPAEAT